MKHSLSLFSTLLLVFNANAQVHPVWELPSSAPNPITPDGHYSTNMMFTTEAYQDEALNKVIAEANLVAKELNLPEDLPIVETNLIGVFISPFGFAYTDQAIGNIVTTNYHYYVSVGNKFSYLDKVGFGKACQAYQKKYVWPIGKLDTNAAYCLATQWLNAIHMDVKTLNQNLHLIIKPDDELVSAPPGKFVPVYYVAWCKKWVDIPGLVFTSKPEWTAVASVRLFAPTKTLLQLRVEDSKYILRPPIIFTNLAELLLQTNAPATTN